jgi:dsRNA-specific ribonuclease
MSKKKEHLSPTDKLERTIAYTFNNKDLLWRAFKHTSAANKFSPDDHNKKLAFLGQAILGLLAADLRFHDPQAAANLFSPAIVANAAAAWHLTEFIKTSPAEAAKLSQPQSRIAGEALTALVGAIYLDSGENLPAMKAWLLKNLPPASGSKNQRDYQQLGPLGTQVLSLLATDYLYHRFPSLPERELQGIRAGCQEQMLRASEYTEEMLAEMYLAGELNTLKQELKAVLTTI